jgi:hypothetical protein
MYKGTNEITNKGLGFKLTNFMNFGESMFPAGYIQKTVKEDPHVRVNNAIPPRNQHGKVLSTTTLVQHVSSPSEMFEEKTKI